MAELLKPPQTSFRFVRKGIIGSDGELPNGWVGESASRLSVEEIDLSNTGPSLTVRIDFGDELASDFVSLSVGPYTGAKRGDLYLLRVNCSIESSQNVEATFLIIREWTENGPFISQATRPLASGVSVVGFEAKGEKRVLQPVISLKRGSPAPGMATIKFRQVMFANLYDHSGWLSV